MYNVLTLTYPVSPKIQLRNLVPHDIPRWKAKKYTMSGLKMLSKTWRQEVCIMD